MHPVVEALRNLPVQERLQIVEELWEGIRLSEEECPLSETQRAEIISRLNHLRSHPESALTREQVWQQAGRT